MPGVADSSGTDSRGLLVDKVSMAALAEGGNLKRIRNRILLKKNKASLLLIRQRKMREHKFNNTLGQYTNFL